MKEFKVEAHFPLTLSRESESRAVTLIQVEWVMGSQDGPPGGGPQSAPGNTPTSEMCKFLRSKQFPIVSEGCTVVLCNVM